MVTVMYQVCNDESGVPVCTTAIVNIAVGSPDLDNDGLTNEEEAQLGTDPMNPDSDGDGILDGQEFTDNTNPLEDCDSIGGTPLSAGDCDGDGLTNGDENSLGTDPNVQDTDGDGINDGQEANEGTDPLDSCDFINGIPLADDDCDGDGLLNSEEDDNRDGNLFNDDCDGDGIPDFRDKDSCDFRVSEAFTPNGDGINDNWMINGIENFPNSVVTLYNRWGHEIFGATNYQNDWTGFYKNNTEKVPPGSYYYTIDLGNGSKPREGWIFINY